MIRIKRDDHVNLIEYKRSEIQLQIVNDLLDLNETEGIKPWHRHLYEYYQTHLREYALLLAISDDVLRSQIFNSSDVYRNIYLREIYDILNELPPIDIDFLIFGKDLTHKLQVYTHYNNKEQMFILHNGTQVAYLQRTGIYLIGT